MRKVRIPLGVVLMVYEARPNVTADAAALCVKSGNAVLLRPGSEALRSSLALAAFWYPIAIAIVTTVSWIFWLILGIRMKDA